MPQAGIFRFRSRQYGKFAMQIRTVENMRTAVENLPAVLGRSLIVDTQWNEEKKKYVRLSR